MNKQNIVKRFAKERMNTLGIMEDVDSWDSMTIDGLPESNIVTIVESYCSMKNQGLDDYSIFQNIENHRSSFDPYPNPKPLPTNPTLNDYIYFRLEFELPSDAGFNIGENGFTRDFIERVINESSKLFSSN